MSSSDTTSATWRKSTYSTPQGSCVETGSMPGRILIRDTTQRGNGPVMSVTPQSWRQFTAGIRDGAPIS